MADLGTTAIRNENRVAADTVRGFLSQVLLCALRWLALRGDQILVVEGNEDIDTHQFTDGSLTQANEESVKDLAGRLTARDEAVYETLANFAEAFDHYDCAGVSCELAFTTTASVGNQRLSTPKGVTLPFDILQGWAAWRRGEPSAPTPEAIFSAVVRLVRSRIKLNSRAGPGRALVSIAVRGRREPFLRSIVWNFDSAKVSTLQDRLVAGVAVLEGGNLHRAHAVAEHLLAFVWRAAASSEVAVRTLTSGMLAVQREEITHRQLQWEAWQRMMQFTSWSSWNADYLSIAVVDDDSGSWSATAVAVCYLPTQDEARLAVVFGLCRDDRVVRPEVRALLSQTRWLSALWADATVSMRVLDAVRDTGLEFYVGCAPRRATAADLLATIKVRARVAERTVCTAHPK